MANTTINANGILIIKGNAVVDATGALKLPEGSTEQRPSTGANGYIRYNTSNNSFEGYTSAGWGAIGGGGSSGNGYTGSEGPTGFTGSAGDVGFTGSVGPSGSDGTSVTILGTVASESALPGYPGSYGGSVGDGYIVNGDLYVWTGSAWSNVGPIRGPQGVQGTAGVQGAIGAQGRQGFQGVQGAAGAQGATGAQGAIGAQGATGVQGVQGAVGAQGRQGYQGALGAQGVQGSPGSVSGVQGPQGITGAQGIQGALGPQGPTGAQGAPGVQGAQGVQGAGVQGTAGVQGAIGAQGRQGFQGVQGAAGAQGATGSGSITNIAQAGGVTLTQTTTGYTGSIATSGTVAVDSTVVRTTGDQSIAGVKTFNGDIRVNGRYIGDVTATGATIDCSQGNYFTDTIAGATTYVFNNVPAGSYSFTLELTHNGGAITWPTSVRWPGGVAPAIPPLMTGKTHLFIFVTVDSGTIWRGTSLINYTTS